MTVPSKIPIPPYSPRLKNPPYPEHVIEDLRARMRKGPVTLRTEELERIIAMLEILSERCGAAYQIVGVLSDRAGLFHHPAVVKAVATDAHAVLLMDQAGWHTSDKLDLPANSSIMLLPPKWPELNPTENTWQFMRENWLSNRVFKSAEDILDHCCDAWNKLVDQPWRIMSIGLRDWANGF